MTHDELKELALQVLSGLIPIHAGTAAHLLAVGYLGISMKAGDRRVRTITRKVDEWTPAVLAWLATLPPGYRVRTLDVLQGALGIEDEQCSKAKRIRAAYILRATGHSRRKVRDGARTFWVWSKE